MSGAVKHQPATPLPWRSSHPMKLDDGAARRGLVRIDSHGPAVAQMVEYMKTNAAPVQDARYIAHAANAYPKLVEALLYSVSGGSSDPTCIENPHDRALRVLREIGEGE